VSGWVTAQAEQLAAVRADAAPLPVRETPYARAEPVGLTALLDLATTLYGDTDPTEVATTEDLLSVDREGSGFVLSIRLPLARIEELGLSRSGDELVITVAGHRRLLALPSALRRCDVAGAKLVQGRLLVRFEPDPDQWRTT
jgi:arsenite-transporting ATPase